MNIPSTRLAEIQDVAMGKSQAPKLTPVEEQQLVGEVLFLRTKVEEVAAWIGPLRQANTAWAAANAALRAYKERTEAGLLRMCSKVSEEDFANYGLVVDQSASRTWRVRDMVREDMDVNRLWRDPPQAEVQP